MIDPKTLSQVAETNDKMTYGLYTDVKPAQEATFSEMLASANSENQDKLYAQINAQDDTLLQFVDNDTQNEMNAVD